MNSIGGIIKIQVPHDEKTLEISVHMFASEYTNKGAKNPAYESIERVMNEYTSIAAAGGVDGADRVRITNGKLTMNEYYSQDGRLVSFPRVTASFVSKNIGKDGYKQIIYRGIIKEHGQKQGLAIYRLIKDIL